MGDWALPGHLQGEDFTFDRSGEPGGYCLSCSAQARMVGAAGEVLRAGVCQSPGCRGYPGHPPAGRPQGEDHDTEDEVPLLTGSGGFSPHGCSSSAHHHNGRELLHTMDHCHATEPADAARATVKKMRIAFIICAVFVVFEFIGGALSGSLAIIGDAAHMLSDLANFGLNLFVLWLSQKRPRKWMTFGFQRAQLLGALASLVIIYNVTGVLVYLAIQRIINRDFEVQDKYMLAAACVAVLVNVLMYCILHSGHGHTHGPGGHQHLDGHDDDRPAAGSQINIRATSLHILGDFLSSLGVLLSSILIATIGEPAKLADPICTLLFAAIVLCTTLPVFRDTLLILAEGKPADLDYDGILADLQRVEGVVQVHSLHLWALTTTVPVCSAHLTVGPGEDPARVRLQAVGLLRARHGLYRTTLQVEEHQDQAMAECDQCQPLQD